MKGSVPSWLPSAECIAAEVKRRQVRREAEAIAARGEERWPAWPPEADHDYHAWVRDNWSIPASDAYDLAVWRDEELYHVVLEEFCYRMLAQRAEPEVVRAALREFDFPLWPESWEGEWWHFYKPWPPVPLKPLRRSQAEFVRLMWGAVRALSYRADVYEAQSTGARRRFEKRWALPEEELLADLRERRICGIRGRYRVLGSVWDVEHGITAADIDAP